MNQKIAFTTILVAFSVLFICFTNASPIGLSPRSPGSVAYVDFTKPILGRVTFTELRGQVVRVTGQFNTGFPDSTSKYEYQITGEEKGVIENDEIFPPGTSPFQFEVKNITIQFFVGKNLTIFRNSNVLETEPIKLV
ncbi:1165_t:CDS:1 [Diversispora eburnea]|uniref:1165_t:CDS:1 n=1 Tax=Diversispora eburnea TaxID=1213867 RepID=A0A9N9EZ65_9GLOM|nr:1165_t:CDS:1 [Diversispora eburnea]